MKAMLAVVGAGMVMAGSWPAVGQTGGYSFTILNSEIAVGDPGMCVALTISGNGQVIAGGDTNGVTNEKPWVWRKVGTGWARSQLPVPPRGSAIPQDVGRPLCISFDGDVVGGTCAPLISQIGQPWYGRPAVWRSVLGASVTLDTAAPSQMYGGVVAAMSADGQHVAYWGYFPNTLWSIFSWEAGSEPALVLPQGPPEASFYYLGSPVTGNAMSGDGSVLAIADATLGGVLQAGAFSAFALPAGSIVDARSLISGVSSDGTTFVGYRRSNANSSTIWPCVWRSDGTARLVQAVRAGSFLQTPFGAMLDVSANGQVIGGVGGILPNHAGAHAGVSGSDALVWINEHPVLLRELLTVQGVSMTGITPYAVTGVSDDGSTLTGFAQQAASGQTPARMISFVATILPPGLCDDIDFNRDGVADQLDVSAFLSVYSEGPCIPVTASCRDIDFNNDGSLFDPRDIEAFLSVFGEGPCL